MNISWTKYISISILFFELQLFNFISWYVAKYLVLRSILCIEVLKLNCISNLNIYCLAIYFFVYLFVCFWVEKNIKIKSKWNEKEIKIEINQIEINFTFVIWRNKRTKWKVCILFSNYKYLIKVFILDILSKNFYGCIIIVSNYYLIAFEFEYLLLFVLNQLFLKMQIKKYN